MSKIGKVISVSFLLVMLLVLVVGQASAAFVGTSFSGYTDPVVTPIGSGFTPNTAVIEMAFLKGAKETPSQSIVPVGREDEQFGSNGLVISGLTGNQKVMACFGFARYNYKWAGNIFQWNGTQWVKLETTFTEDPAATTYACASGLGNGTYALIMYYWGPQEMNYTVATALPSPT